jgi:hypothetical protein|tara:strand:+ start:90 stop:503 length:414 start_codon:yes stop_codon:yes gene_type:complete
MCEINNWNFAVDIVTASFAVAAFFISLTKIAKSDYDQKFERYSRRLEARIKFLSEHHDPELSQTIESNKNKDLEEYRKSLGIKASDAYLEFLVLRSSNLAIVELFEQALQSKNVVREKDKPRTALVDLGERIKAAKD